MFIPGWLISMITFPGIMIHEWAHKKFCDWNDVVVHQVVYFRFGNPAGFVVHDEPKNYKQTLFISAGPLIINSIIAILLSFLASQTIPESFLYYIFLWIAISAGMHAFPSDHDGKNVLLASKESIKNGGTTLHYLAYPFYWMLWTANVLRFFWFDLLYAALLVYLGGGFYQ